MQHLSGRKRSYALNELPIRKYCSGFSDWVQMLIDVFLLVLTLHCLYSVLRGK